MFTWNLDADFPETLPVAIAYAMLVNTLNEKTNIPKSGFMSFDYCTGYAPDCRFKEYCSSLIFGNSLPDEDMNMTSSETDELPF